MLNTNILYQYGDLVFGSDNFEVKRRVGVKTQLEDSPFFNGKIRSNKSNANYLDEVIYDCSYSVKTNDGYYLNQLEALFFSKMQKIFFIEKFNKSIDKNDNIPTSNLTDIDYRVYLAYGEIVKMPDSNFDGKSNDIINFTVRQSGRKYLIEDSRLNFVKFKDEAVIVNNWSDNQGNWGDTFGNWGSDGIIKTQFNLATQKQRQDLINCCKPIGFFQYKDLFFKQEVTGIDTTTNNYTLVNLTTTQGNGVSLMVSTETPTRRLGLVSTLPNRSSIFEIQKDGTAPALANGEFIEILNNKSMSGFRITCLNANCPPKISIFTHKSVKLFYTDSNEPLPYLNPGSNQFLGYKIESVGTQSSFFEFSNFYPILKNINNVNNNTIHIKRNFNGNYQIKIATLPTFI